MAETEYLGGGYIYIIIWDFDIIASSDLSADLQVMRLKYCTLCFDVHFLIINLKLY